MKWYRITENAYRASVGRADVVVSHSLIRRRRLWRMRIRFQLFGEYFERSRTIPFRGVPTEAKWKGARSVASTLAGTIVLLAEQLETTPRGLMFTRYVTGRVPR